MNFHNRAKNGDGNGDELGSKLGVPATHITTTFTFSQKIFVPPSVFSLLDYLATAPISYWHLIN